jgi:Predicted AAA-ATPase/PD-(D/E)XK nuclease superfamily
MQKRKLPIGIQSLAEIINGGYYYVDKTPLIYPLVTQGKYYFLSRPRRFGKSLLIDTIKELYEGNEALFQGLFVYNRWDWTKKNPVIRLDFGEGVLSSRQSLDDRIDHLLQKNSENLGITPSTARDIPGRFSDLIINAHKKFNAQVVLLIDEYDKPILDNITNKDAANETREGLKNLYTVLKSSDPHIAFCMLTGVSKFSKVSLFSGLNNLHDITLTAEYSSLCGYTDEDMDTVFAPDLQGLDRAEIRRWYNGYNWGGASVYNPFDVLLFLKERVFRDYWFETATPTFLVKLLREHEFFTPDLNKLQTTSQLLSQFDVEYISVEALLFQAGYLTILNTIELLPNLLSYELGYPNYEVEVSLNRSLLPALGVDISRATRNYSAVLSALRTLDFSALETLCKSLYASIPHDWYRKNPLANYEGHYASIFYSHFAALGLQIAVEEATSTGKIDMAIEFNQTVFMFEFKVVDDQPLGTALAQLRQKNYAEKYRSKNIPIILIGVEFSKLQRQIVGFETMQYI